MLNKLAVTLVLATTTFVGSASASDKDPTPYYNPEAMEIVKDDAILDDLWKTEPGQKLIEILHSDVPIVDEVDQGAQCNDISAGKQFRWPLYSTDIAGFGVQLGVAGDIGIVADSTRMAAEASFGPSLTVFGQQAKPIELRLSASTNSMGQNSVDLKLLAFAYELESYNITNSTAPLEYIRAVGWSLPNAVSGTMGNTYDCSALPVLDTCSASWSVTPLVASIGGIFALRVNSNGVQAHGLAAANAHSNVNVSGSASVKAIDLNGDPKTYTFNVSGSGVVNFMHAMFWGSATLAPHNGHWIASAESSIAVEDVFGAKVQANVDLSSIGHDPLTWMAYEHEAMALHDLWSYQCSFDKNFK